jgi:hypothetical protein
MRREAWNSSETILDISEQPLHPNVTLRPFGHRTLCSPSCVSLR